MKNTWTLYTAILTILLSLTGCEKLLVLDPKGPQAQTQANDIILSIWIMSIIVIVIFIMLAYMLFKYRSSKQVINYTPPHIEGSTLVEIICVGIPILIVIFLSIVSVKSNYTVESIPPEYNEKEPLVIYAATSNWKWHFSYPEQEIETVNYLYIPTDRPLEFRLYSYGPITSFWIPQLGGQKYAMADMVNTLYLAADEPGEYMGRNSNFNGKGFAENIFNVTALTQDDFDKWVTDVKKTAKTLRQEEFNELLKPGHLGQSTYNGTHLDFLPPPEGMNGEHGHSSSHSVQSDDSLNENNGNHNEH